MITTYTHKNLTWVDLESPTAEELAPIAEKYNVHPLVVHELLSPSDRSKVDLYDNCIYLILHFPTTNIKNAGAIAEEVDFVIGKNFVITTHYANVDVLHEFGKKFETNALLNRKPVGTHAGFLFFAIIEHLYTSLEEQLDYVTENLQIAKTRIFRGEERAMVEQLSSISHHLLDFRLAVRSHATVWESFEKAGSEFFGSSFSYYLSTLSGEYQKIANMLESNKEILSDLRATNDALLTTKVNETLVHLSMMAFVVFPLTLIAGLFSMDTIHTPIVGSYLDFWKVVGLMVLTTFGVFLYFRYRKWL